MSIEIYDGDEPEEEEGEDAPTVADAEALWVSLVRHIGELSGLEQAKLVRAFKARTPWDQLPERFQQMILSAIDELAFEDADDDQEDEDDGEAEG